MGEGVADELSYLGDYGVSEGSKSVGSLCHRFKAFLLPASDRHAGLHSFTLVCV
jgi:hypothetical protein